MVKERDKTQFPKWLRSKLSDETAVGSTVSLLESLSLNTVCQSAHCPNIGVCFSRRTATFLILGTVCTRSCTFCAVRKGEPTPVDPDEPSRVAQAVERLGLRYVVVTSVTRDDLPDGGSGQFIDTIRAIRSRCPGVMIEVLVPDFRGEAKLVESVVNAQPEVFGHNLETVPRLHRDVRPNADYARSLRVLEAAKERSVSTMTKSGIMVVLGERHDEVIAVMKDLRGVGCDIFTVGQYLSPSKRHHPVVEFVPPEVFDEYGRVGRELGFRHVASGPLVRSSYMADAAFSSATKEGDLVDGVRSQSA